MEELLYKYATTLESISGLPSKYTISILSKKTDYLDSKDIYSLFYKFTSMLSKCPNKYIKDNFDKYITRLICRKLDVSIKNISNDNNLVERIFIIRGIPNTIVEYLTRNNIILEELESISLSNVSALDYIDILNNKDIPHEKRNKLLSVYLKRISKYYDNTKLREELDEYLNNLSKTYIKIILNKYGKYLTNEARIRLRKAYTTNCVVIDNTYDKLIIKYLNNNIDISNLPDAHGTRVFNDDKIHFYITKNNKSLEDLERTCSGILLHELLHLVVRPKRVKDENINRVVDEGLVDMLTRDINKEYHINEDYSSNYAPYILYIRNTLEGLENKNDLIFKGNVKDIVSLSNIDELKLAKDKKTIYDDIIMDIALRYQHSESIKRKLYDMIANCKDKKEIDKILEGDNILVNSR